MDRNLSVKKAYILAFLFVLWFVGCGERPQKSTGSTFESRQGTPIISINYDDDFAKHSGLLTHVGQTEYDAGYKEGEKRVSAGITQGIFVNKEVGNLSLDLLSQGFAAVVKRSGGTAEVLTVDLAYPTETQQRITAVLTSNSEVNGFLTLGPTGFLTTLALEDLGKFDQIILATLI